MVYKDFPWPMGDLIEPLSGRRGHGHGLRCQQRGTTREGDDGSRPRGGTDVPWATKAH